MTGRARLILGATMAVIAGCSLVPVDPAQDPAGDLNRVHDCQPPFVFDGETTLRTLALDQFDDLGVDAERPGRIQITSARVRWEDFAPPEASAVVPDGQLLCVTWLDGGGMSTLLHEPYIGWGTGIAAEEASGGQLPVPLLGAMLVILVVGVLSWLAFRRDPTPRNE